MRSDRPLRAPLLAATALVLLGLGGPARAQAASPDAVSQAIDKGVAWVRARQQQDGSFRDHWFGQGYKAGETALALLTLLKAGVAPDDPAIARGFDWLLAQPTQRVYDVSVSVLALEARYTPPPDRSIQDAAPLATQIRQRFAKVAPPRDRNWLAQAVQFLLTHQDASGVWKYPFFGEPDVSNAQFAVLALKAARRMSVKVPKDPFVKVAEYLLRHQEGEGPDVPTFPVPAADQPIQGLHDRRARAEAQRRARAGGQDGGTKTRDGGEELESRSRLAMKARGWAYRPGQVPRGSMTAAGLAILVIVKDELEDMPRYDEKLGPAIDRALRDGAAWIAQRFRVDAHPGAEPDWLFYWLYTLERAGTLLAVDRFGGRDWYREGSQVLLGRQQGDGRFLQDGGSGERDGELAGTCLAVLFLKRSTVPVVQRVRTGGEPPAAAGGPRVERRPDGLWDVTFTLRAAPGQRVAVAGSFNGWSQDAAPCADRGEGTFVATLTLPAGRHTYKFVVDGASWRPDPENPRGDPDGHGGQNSVLELE